jgi:hypothetical protein
MAKIQEIKGDLDKNAKKPMTFTSAFSIQIWIKMNSVGGKIT